jgi:1,4-alpha-glucan branching enzyme
VLKKRRFKKDNMVKVTFQLPPELDAETVRLAGDFTDWQPAHELRRQKDGSWRATVELEPGREYEFRYVVDGERWMNDPEADRYADNPYGDGNSVVVT